MINSVYANSAARVSSYNYPTNRHKYGDIVQSYLPNQTDRVTFSDQAQAMWKANQAENSAQGDGTSCNLLSCAQTLSEHATYMINNLEAITSEFQSDLKQQLAAQGIDVSTEIKLTTAGDGSVVVVGDHPDAAEIEQFFKDNPEMRDRFADISAHTQMKRALDLHMEFAEAYEKDPEGAVAKYFPLFDMMKREGYTMSLGGQQEDDASAA